MLPADRKKNSIQLYVPIDCHVLGFLNDSYLLFDGNSLAVGHESRAPRRLDRGGCESSGGAGEGRDECNLHGGNDFVDDAIRELWRL